MMPPLSADELLAVNEAKKILSDSPKESPALLEILLQAYRNKGKETCALEVRRFQCFALMCNLEYDRAQENLRLLITEAKAINEQRFLGVAEMYFGLMALDQGQCAKAIECFDHAIQIGTELQDVDLIYRVQTNLAYAQMLLGQYEEALDTLRLGIRHFDTTGTFAGNGTILYNMAVARTQIAFREKINGRLQQEHLDLARHDLSVAEAECQSDPALWKLVRIHWALFQGLNGELDEGIESLYAIFKDIPEGGHTHLINYLSVETQLIELQQDWNHLCEKTLALIGMMKDVSWFGSIQSILKRAANAHAKVGRFEVAYNLLSESMIFDTNAPRHQQVQVASLRLDLERHKFDQEVLRMRNRTLIERNKILEQESRFDPLSGILNRRGTEEALQQFTERKFADRFVIVLLDIDHFKRINDDFGHAVGDQVIQEFSSCLATSKTKPSKLGRWGGEEFLIVFDGDNEIDMARLGRTLVEEIRELNWDHIQPGMRVTASCGLSMWKRGDSLDEAIRIADDMIYAVKNHGRNNWQVAA